MYGFGAYFFLGVTSMHFDKDVLCQDIYMHGFVQERRKPSALAIDLRLSCTNPSIRT